MGDLFKIEAAESDHSDNGGKHIWVNLVSGDDSTGDGSHLNPYLTRERAIMDAEAPRRDYLVRRLENAG